MKLQNFVPKALQGVKEAQESRREEASFLHSELIFVFGGRTSAETESREAGIPKAARIAGSGQCGCTTYLIRQPLGLSPLAYR